MKKRIFAGIAVIAISAVVAINVTLGSNKLDGLSLFALANVEALANGENGGEMKYQCKVESICEDIYYYRIYGDICQKVTVTEHLTECIGMGSVSCTPSFKVEYEFGDFVLCSTCNGLIAG